jgi:hypothetical protein
MPTFTLQANKYTTLASTITAVASTATLASAAFTNFTSDYLIFDYDNPALLEIVLCNVTGTAVASMTRGTNGTSGQAHSAGAKIMYGFIPSHYSAVVDGSGLTLTALPNNTILANQLATNAIKGGTATASGQSGVTGVVDVTGCSVSVTIPAGGRSVLVLAVGSASSNNAAGLTSFDIQAAGSNMTGGNFRVTHNNAANSFTAMGFAVETPAAGSRTYKLRATGVVGTSAIDASTNLIVLII